MHLVCIATINFGILSGVDTVDRLQYPSVSEQQRLNGLHGTQMHDFLSVA